MVLQSPGVVGVSAKFHGDRNGNVSLQAFRACGNHIPLTSPNQESHYTLILADALTVSPVRESTPNTPTRA